MSKNEYSDYIKGGFSFINFKPELSEEQFKIFKNAVNYRLKQVDFIVYTLTEMSPELDSQTLYENHAQDYLDFQERALPAGHFKTEYPNVLGVPTNLLSIIEMAKVLRQTNEFCKTANAPIKDTQLLEQFITEPPYRELSEEETRQETKRIMDEHEKKENLYGKTYQTEDQKMDLSGVVAFKMIEGDALQIAQYCETGNAIVDVFRLFRLSQREMLNDWENKIMAAQLGDILVLPEHVLADDDKKSVKDMFDANVITMLSTYEAHNTIKSLYRNDVVGQMTYEAELTHYFEEAQIYLQRLFQLEYDDVDYETVWENNEPAYYGFISPDEYRTYCTTISDEEQRKALQTVDDDWLVAVPAYSSRFYKTGLSDMGQKSFDNVLYKEIRNLAEANGFDLIPKSVDELRSISLKKGLHL